MHIVYIFFFFNDTATTEIYTLSLHDALPISVQADAREALEALTAALAGFSTPDAYRERAARLNREWDAVVDRFLDRKSTRLNSSHANISYAVFCLKKKNKNTVDIISSTAHRY